LSSFVALSNTSSDSGSSPPPRFDMTAPWLRHSSSSTGNLTHVLRGWLDPLRRGGRAKLQQQQQQHRRPGAAAEGTMATSDMYPRSSSRASDDVVVGAAHCAVSYAGAGIAGNTPYRQRRRRRRRPRPAMKHALLGGFAPPEDDWGDTPQSGWAVLRLEPAAGPGIPAPKTR
jgi:hypothetical protein